MAKSYEPCYTKTDSKGNTYKTCEGAQKKRSARAKLKKGGAPPPMVKKKKKVGVDETPEQNEQKAFLKLQKKKISQGFAGNNTGRINTGTLNPANPNLNVNPWQVQPEIEAKKPTYEVDTGLFMEALATIVDVAKGSYFKLGPIDEDGRRQLTYQGVEYQIADGEYVFDEDEDFVGKWNPTARVIVFETEGMKEFHESMSGQTAPEPPLDPIIVGGGRSEAFGVAGGFGDRKYRMTITKQELDEDERSDIRNELSKEGSNLTRKFYKVNGLAGYYIEDLDYDQARTRHYVDVGPGFPDRPRLPYLVKSPYFGDERVARLYYSASDSQGEDVWKSIPQSRRVD